MGSSCWRISSAARAVGVLALLGAVAPHAFAQLPAEPLVTQQLPPRGTAHWLWLNDFAFPHLTDGRAYLIDADQGRMLGVLSTGFSFIAGGTANMR